MCLPRTKEPDLDDPYWEPLVTTENGSPVPEVHPTSTAPEEEVKVSPIKGKRLDFSTPSPAEKKNNNKRPLPMPMPSPSSTATSPGTSILSATPPAKSPRAKKASKSSPKEKKAMV